MGKHAESPRTAPRRPARLGPALLRTADRHRRWRRAARRRRRRQPIPRLLRRDPGHDDRISGARGRRRDQGPGRPNAPHLDSVLDRVPNRACREGGGALGHSRRQGLLHQLGDRGQRRRLDARHHIQEVEPGAGDHGAATTASHTRPSPSPGTRHGRGPASRRSRSPTSMVATSSAAHSGTFPTTSSSRHVWPISKTCSEWPAPGSRR